MNIPVLDHGYVQYNDHLGSDQLIVQSARTSHDGEGKGEKEDKKLLFYLYRNRHTSPFEHASITFTLQMPIFVARQFVRHRTFRLNEVSARYTQLDDRFYVPKVLRKPTPKDKQSSVEGFTDEQNRMMSDIIRDSYEKAYAVYEHLIGMGVANEMARLVLPVGIYTKMVVNIDMNNLLKFFTLRDDPHAQWEHQQYAKAMKEITRSLFPWCMEAYDRYKHMVVDMKANVQL